MSDLALELEKLIEEKKATKQRCSSTTRFSKESAR